MRLAHINLVARNAEALADFYINIMKCELLRAPRLLSGEQFSKGNGLANSDIYSIWLKFPAPEHPFLEIHQHTIICDRDQPSINEPGFGHLAFQMNNINDLLAKIIQAGGSQIGKTTDLGTSDRPCLIAYARDPEGNVLELEQTSE